MRNAVAPGVGMFPVDLKLKGRQVLVVGSGRVGRRKLAKLLAAGARVLLAEPRPSEEVQAWAESGALELVGEFSESLMEARRPLLVFAATSNPGFNRRVAEAARARGFLVNVADDPEISDFFLPAVIERGDFQLTVGTGGASPALAARVAAELRERYGPEYGEFAALMAEWRPRVLSSGLADSARAELFKRLVESEEVWALLKNGRRDQLEKYLRGLLPAKESDMCGNAD